MVCVLICVVLGMIARFGHVDSSVINRTSTDFEQSIFDYYGSPRLSGDHHTSHKNMAIKDHIDAESIAIENKHVEKLIAQDELDISVLNNIWGAPPLAPLREKGNIHTHKDTSSAEMFTLKTDMMKLLGKPNTPSGSMIATKSPDANKTGPVFDTDDRFLSETLIRSNWMGNVEEKPTSTETPRHSNTPIDDVATQTEHPSDPKKVPTDTVILRHAIIPQYIPAQTEKPNVRTTEDLKPEQTTISSVEHIVTSSEKNASNKWDITYRYIFLIVACLYIVR